MVLKYPKGHRLQVDYGTDRIYYDYYVVVHNRQHDSAQSQWCRENFKPYSWWYRHHQKEFAFVREKDAMWFSLKWC